MQSINIAQFTRDGQRVTDAFWFLSQHAYCMSAFRRTKMYGSTENSVIINAGFWAVWNIEERFWNSYATSLHEGQGTRWRQIRCGGMRLYRRSIIYTRVWPVSLVGRKPIQKIWEQVFYCLKPSHSRSQIWVRRVYFSLSLKRMHNVRLLIWACWYWSVS